MISAEASAMWEALRSGPRTDMAVEELRAFVEQFEAPTAEPEGVTYSPADTVGGLWAEPAQSRDGAAILYFYGGGFACGTPTSRRKTAGHLALAARARVLVPSYRLAPEHPFPAALDDATAAYHFILGQQVDPARWVIAGDSAGAGLAMAVQLLMLDREQPLPAGSVLISPWADLCCQGESMNTRADVDLMCDRTSILALADRYLQGHDPRDRYASPALTDLTGLPPVLALVGGSEVLLDDAVRLVRSIGAGGGDATLFVGAEMQHVWPVWCGAFPEATRAIALIGNWVLDHTT